MTVLDILNNSMTLLGNCTINLVDHVVADHCHVRGNDNHLQTVDLLKLERLGIGRAGHAGKLVVQAKIILEGYGGQRLIFVLNRNPFLSLHRLMQAVGPTPSGHHSSREFVDDHDLIVFDDVIDFALKKSMGAQRSAQMMHQSDIDRVIKTGPGVDKIGLGQQFFYVVMTFLGQIGLTRLLIE